LRAVGLPALLLFLAACSATPDRPAATKTETATTGPELAPVADDIVARPDEKTVQLTFAAVGDMMLGTDYPQDHLPDDDGAGFLAAIAPILASVDLTFGNLEGVLVDGGTPAKKCSNPNACYLFRSPTRYAQHFVNAGFDALSLANNHARDFGEDGRSSTMLALSNAGIAHSGRAGDFASLQSRGLTIAFVAFSVTRNSNLLHDYALAAQTVTAQAMQHDIVVVSFHGGAEGRNTTRIPFAEEEYFGEPRGDVVRFARSMVDAGADFVFGHGPHVVRGMERYKDRLIAYSLGNFATYYGISVSDIKGIAPILMVTVDQQGRFVKGHVYSTVQIRPGGPQLDPEQRVLTLVRELSHADFGKPGLRFHADGEISATP